MDTSLKLALVVLKQELETGGERHLRDTRCSGSESQMTDSSSLEKKEKLKLIIKIPRRLLTGC